MLKEKIYTIEEIEIIKPYGFIYITTNQINGRKYIGQRKIRIQWEYYLGSGVVLKQAIKKYGKENFSREIITIAYSKIELDKLEIEFINNYNAVNDINFYNIAPGGGSPAIGPHSEEHNRKISESEKGRIFSEETKGKISKANTGKTQTEEHKQSLIEYRKSEKYKEYVKNFPRGEQSPNYGKTRSKESIEKARETRMVLTSEQITEIREKYATENYTQAQLGEEYSVGGSTISSIVNFKNAYKIDNFEKEFKNNKGVRIICINTNEIFNSITEASIKYNIDACGVVIIFVSLLE